MTPNVVVVCVPEQYERLAALRAADVPRLVVASAGAGLPEFVSDREEWVLFPAGAVEVNTRLEELRARVSRCVPPRPSLDSDGLLHVGTSWVALSATNVKIVETLVADFGCVVPTSTLMQAFVIGTRKLLRQHMSRLRQSVAPLGLAIRSVRSCGYLMNFASGV